MAAECAARGVGVVIGYSIPAAGAQVVGELSHPLPLLVGVGKLQPAGGNDPLPRRIGL